MDEKIRLSVLGFSFNQVKSGAYGLVLAEEYGLRRLMIIVGTAEAQAIAFKLQGTVPPRPLTHDLFQTLLLNFGIYLLEVNIYKFEDGVFFSRMVFKQGADIINIESRTSDAINIALRTKSPIYTTELIMKTMAIVPEDDDESHKDEPNKLSQDYSLLSKEELEVLLKDAIDGEDYELASLIRDELAKKKNKN